MSFNSFQNLVFFLLNSEAAILLGLLLWLWFSWMWWNWWITGTGRGCSYIGIFRVRKSFFLWLIVGIWKGDFFWGGGLFCFTVATERGRRWGPGSLFPCLDLGLAFCICWANSILSASYAKTPDYVYPLCPSRDLYKYVRITFCQFIMSSTSVLAGSCP